MPDHTIKDPLDPSTLTEDMKRRRLEIREWLDQRERELGLVEDAPPDASEHQEKK
jgi:hypothetical protein